MSYIKDFSEIGKGDAAIAGGKGASLGEMTQAGIPVPSGFVVLADAFEKFLDETDLNTEIDTILHTVKTDEMRSVEHASERIQKLILEAKMSKKMGDEILKAYKVLCAEPAQNTSASNEGGPARHTSSDVGGYVAVRSSATAEDSNSAAWAGQLDTFLNTTEENLLENVQKCWASLFTPRAIFYRFEKDFHTTKISVAVVVQKMIQSEISGIAFSVHPVTEDHNQLIIEAGWGLGEAIVSGQITPDSYVVEKNPRRIIDVNIANQERGIFRNRGPSSNKHSRTVLESERANEWREIPKQDREKQKLSEEQILELAELVIKIENHYGFPCDIEWAYVADPEEFEGKGGKFYITQSRPITTLTSPSADLLSSFGNFTKKKFPVMVEDYDVPLNPWSFLYEVFLYGVPNIANNEISGPDNIFIYEKNRVFWGADPEQFSRVSKYFLAKLHVDSHFFSAISIGIRELLPKADGFMKKMAVTDFNKKNNQELFNIFQEGTELYAGLWNWGMVGQFLDMGDDKLSDRLKERLYPILIKYGEPEVVFSKLITWLELTKIAEESLAVLHLAVEIQADSSLARKVKETESSSHLPRELQKKLQVVTDRYGWIQYYYAGPGASVEYYFGLLKKKLQTNAVDELEIREDERRELDKLQKTIARELSKADRRLIEDLSELSFLKEVRKEGLYRVNFGLDGWYKEIGRRFHADTFLARYILKAEYEEILTKGVPFIAEQELQDRYDLCAYISIDGKDELIVGPAALKYKERLQWPEVPTGTTELIKGSVAYPGYAKGKAVIVNSIKDLEKFAEGNILISIATTPVIVPAMNKAAAIVTDSGGVTCHAAIVSRELKIPCVIGTKIATRIIKDGDFVEVDAERGIVKILE